MKFIKIEYWSYNNTNVSYIKEKKNREEDMLLFFSIDSIKMPTHALIFFVCSITMYIYILSLNKIRFKGKQGILTTT